MKLLIWSIILLFITACNQTELKLTNNYYLKASPDDSNSFGVYFLDGEYFVGIIKPKVLAIDYNESYLIVQQHPEDSGKIDNDVINYFIIPFKNKVSNSEEKNLIGPLSKSEFEKKRKDLKLPKELILKLIKDF